MKFHKLTRKVRSLFVGLNSFWGRTYLKADGVKLSNDLIVRGRIYCENDGDFTIGESCRINSAYWANPIGGGDITSFRTFGNGKIEIGRHCGISNAAFVSGSLIKVEDEVLIGSGCCFWDTDFHSLNSKLRIDGDSDSVRSRPIVIEKGAFIGGKSIILKGVTIGEFSIIGAGSVVTRSVPSNEIWGGNPARFIRKVENERELDASDQCCDTGL